MTDLPKTPADTEPQKSFDMLEFIGNNGWAPNPQSERMCPVLLQTLADHDVSITETQDEMRRRGFDEGAVKQLQEWENKRVYGAFRPKPHHRRLV